ncbi:hypothetical protein SBRCBS47491_005092 [Sporothrix bragantina]|uniref:Uncharacterized protein n=1 Tax=Sporothrix bragantina TaxID=671064 RepID=A0ABP0BVL8_9PEZI
MADGTYGSPFYQGNMAPGDGNAPTNKFTTNINRKKTRKWVDAKKINYDGAGWGDEDDDEDDGGYEEEPPLPPMPMPSAAAAQRALPSQQPPPPATRNLPSTLAPGINNSSNGGGVGPGGNPRARGSPSPGRMPLNVQTQQQQQQQYPNSQPPAQQQPWRQASPGPGNMPAPRASSQMRAVSPGGPGAMSSPRSGSQPPAGTYTPWREGRSESPLGPRGQSPAGAGPGGPGGAGGPRGPRTMSPAANAGGAGGPVGPRSNLVRPSDIYKRGVASNETSPPRAAEEAAQRGRNDQPVAPATSALSQSPPPAAAGAAPFIPPPDHSVNNINNNTTTSVAQPQPQHKAQDSVDSTTSAAEDAANDRRYSTSPKLPDLARFSTFSPELLFGGSSSGFLAADAPPVPSIPNSPAVGAFPVEGAASTSAAGAPTSTLATVAEGVGSTSRNASPFSTSSGESALAPAPAPIRDSAATTTTAITASSNDDAASTAAGGARGSTDSNPSSVDVPATSAATATVDSRKSSLGGAQVLSESTAAETNAGADQLAQPTLAPSTYSADPTIAPLNPHRLSSMVPFMPPSVTTPMGPREMQRTATVGSLDTPTSTTDSPVKESDMLREEIIRTLSPVKMTHSGESMEVAVARANQERGSILEEERDNSATAAGASADEDAAAAAAASAPAQEQQQQQTKSDHSRTLTRESSYLQDVYDDYWTPDDASANEAYTASDPPPPVPPLAGTGTVSASGTGAAEPTTSGDSSVSGGAAAGVAAGVLAAGSAAAGAAVYASASSSSPSTDNNATPQPSAPEAQHNIAPAPSKSPAPSASLVPGAFPSSETPTPAAVQSSFAQPPNLRRRFSWEAEPEPEQALPAAAAPAPAPIMAHGVSSLPSQQQHLQQQQAAAAAAAADARTQSPPPPAAVLQMSSPMSAVTAPETNNDHNISPNPDRNASVSAVSTSTVAPELTSPSPVSEAATGAGARSTTSPTAEKQEQKDIESEPKPQTQAPVRSMLDVGDEPAPAPAPLRSMLDVGDDPAPQPQQQSQPDNRISTVESVQSASSIPLQAPQPLSPSQAQPLAQPYAAPSIQVYQPAPEAGAHVPNPALFGGANDGNAQFLTLRQCMAFDTHHERMAKLAETRHQYAVADSGLSSWLQSMTSVPEYSRAAYVPLFDGHIGGTGPQGSSVSASRPVAAVAATISRVPHHVHVAVPSGSQISNKSKEIFSVATGKAGKGLLALRKKGFHKKSSN